MPFPLVPFTVPAPPSINPIQLGLLGCQVLIAIVTIWISKRYYDGMTERGKEALELQRGGVHLQYKADYQKTEERITSFCDASVSAAKVGVGQPPNPKSAIKLLRDARKRVDELESSVRGVSNIWEGMLTFRGLLDAYIDSEKQGEPHDTRVTLSVDITRMAESLKGQWKHETAALLKRIEPQL